MTPWCKIHQGGAQYVRKIHHRLANPGCILNCGVGTGTYVFCGVRYTVESIAKHMKTATVLKGTNPKKQTRDENFYHTA